jgi:hypothetical protein
MLRRGLRSIDASPLATQDNSAANSVGPSLNPSRSISRVGSFSGKDQLPEDAARFLQEGDSTGSGNSQAAGGTRASGDAAPAENRALPRRWSLARQAMGSQGVLNRSPSTLDGAPGVESDAQALSRSPSVRDGGSGIAREGSVSKGFGQGLAREGSFSKTGSFAFSRRGSLLSQGSFARDPAHDGQGSQISAASQHLDGVPGLASPSVAPASPLKPALQAGREEAPAAPVVATGARREYLLDTFDGHADAVHTMIEEDGWKTFGFDSQEHAGSKRKGILDRIKGVWEDFLVPPEMRPQYEKEMQEMAEEARKERELARLKEDAKWLKQMKKSEVEEEEDRQRRLEEMKRKLGAAKGTSIRLPPRAEARDGRGLPPAVNLDYQQDHGEAYRGARLSGARHGEGRQVRLRAPHGASLLSLDTLPKVNDWQPLIHCQKSTTGSP